MLLANTINDIYTRVNQMNMLKIWAEKKPLLCAAVHMASHQHACKGCTAKGTYSNMFPTYLH